MNSVFDVVDARLMVIGCYGKVEVDRNRFFQFRPKPNVYLRHGTENETETETEHTDLAESKPKHPTSF